MKYTSILILSVFMHGYSDLPIWKFEEEIPQPSSCPDNPCITIEDIFENQTGISKHIIRYADPSTYQVLNIKDGSVAATLKLPELKSDQGRLTLKFLNGFTGSGWAVLIGDAQNTATNKAEAGIFTVVDENGSVLLTGFGYEFKIIFDGTTSYVAANAKGQGDFKNHWNVYKLKEGISVGTESGIPKKALFKSGTGSDSFLTNGKRTGTKSGSQIIFNH